MAKEVAIVSFPGSHGARDLTYACSLLEGVTTSIVKHSAEQLPKADVLLLPGGSSYADYLRPGALAKATPIARAIRKFAREGGAIIGFGNGFQILCELEILPGGLLHNAKNSFHSELTSLMVENNKTKFSSNFPERSVYALPTYGYFGRYVGSKRAIQDLEANEQIVFRYSDTDGFVEIEKSYNGSSAAIAGIVNRQGNVLGLMAHPERFVEEFMGGTDGLSVLRGLLGIGAKK